MDVIKEAYLFFTPDIEQRLRHGQVEDCFGRPIGSMVEMRMAIVEGHWPVVKPAQIERTGAQDGNPNDRG